MTTKYIFHITYPYSDELRNYLYKGLLDRHIEFGDDFEIIGFCTEGQIQFIYDLVTAKPNINLRFTRFIS